MAGQFGCRTRRTQVGFRSPSLEDAITRDSDNHVRQHNESQFHFRTNSAQSNHLGPLKWFNRSDSLAATNTIDLKGKFKSVSSGRLFELVSVSLRDLILGPLPLRLNVVSFPLGSSRFVSSRFVSFRFVSLQSNLIDFGRVCWASLIVCWQSGSGSRIIKRDSRLKSPPNVSLDWSETGTKPVGLNSKWPPTHSRTGDSSVPLGDWRRFGIHFEFEFEFEFVACLAWSTSRASNIFT